MPGDVNARLASNAARLRKVRFASHCAAIARPGQGHGSSRLKEQGWAGYRAAMQRFLFLFAAISVLFSSPVNASGTKTPYWTAIRAGEVNMRVGPGEEYRIVWVYHRVHLPLKVLRIKEGWWFVEDPDGAQGWVLGRLMTRTRGGFVAGKGPADMREGPAGESKLLWRLAPGNVGTLGDCKQGWCELTIGARTGYVEQDRLWGAGKP